MSVRDLTWRLRLAGDEYWDIRCLIYYGLDIIGWGDFSETYGHTFGFSGFATSRTSGFWRFLYYSENDRPRSALYQKRVLPWERTNRQDKRERQLLIRADCLFNDSFWLANEIGLSRIPGLDGIDTSTLFGGSKTWLWLLFHAAWSLPPGTILRADKIIPVGILGRVLHRQKQEEAAGFPSASKKSPEEFHAALEAVKKRKSSMSREELLQEWDDAMLEAEQMMTKLLEDGCYCSTLPMDPFTASAALLDLMAAETSPTRNSPPPPKPPIVLLNGLGESVYLRGEEAPPLTDPQYNVINTLLDAGPRGLNKDELVKKSGHADAVKILKRVAKLSDNWRSVIGLAGKPGGRYRILDLH